MDWSATQWCSIRQPAPASLEPLGWEDENRRFESSQSRVATVMKSGAAGKLAWPERSAGKAAGALAAIWIVRAKGAAMDFPQPQRCGDEFGGVHL